MVNEERFRFRPPQFDLSPEVRWALLRAFGPAPGGGGRGLGGRGQAPPLRDEGGVGGAARALGLAPRIAWRQDPGRLAGELGEVAAAALRQDLRWAAVQAELVAETARQAAAAAARAGVPMILLKGAALLASGATAPGSRGVGDLDLLVPEEGAAALLDALTGLGFESSGLDESVHHLPCLLHPRLATVEIHLFLPGISAGGRAATAAVLVGAGLCRECPAVPGALLPTPGLLAAHALTHGLVQHGRSPWAYPLLRALADLADLTDLTTAAGGPQDLVESAADLAAGSLSARELRAAGELCRRLGEGTAEADAGDAGALLRHAAAGALDPGYRRRLRLRTLLAALARRDWRKARVRLRLLRQARRRRAGRGRARGVRAGAGTVR